ncbi:Rv2175c family DNA-binding protein [Corynebacterium sp.]|uniref:Rv2175c family DNA-binding protein n=1 Tax=Corynebacterium sp. TaxID=1720 RepID=UPI0034CE362C
MKHNEIPLETLLADEPMLTLPETAERLGVVITRVHDLLAGKKLIAHIIDGKRHIPEALFHEGSDSTGKFVPGLITLMVDGGYSDEEILRYLFTEDETLPGRPVDALHGQLAREVLRRAQAMAL